MRRAIALALWLVVGLAGPAAAEGTVETGLAVRSEALGRELRYSIYLPEGHGQAERRYPVVYLLHGHNGDELSWLRAGHIAQTLDALIAEGALPPLIVVMPDGGNSWYADSPGAGMMATALADDLVAHVERTYRASPRRGARAIAGLSMGGFGALKLAIDRPELFVAAASLSGAVFAGPPDRTLRDDLFGDVFGDPFDPERFARANPLDRVVDALEEVPAPPAFYLTVGDDDWFGFWRGTSLLFMELRDAGLEAELRVKDGGHTWDFWADEIGPALVFLARHFESR